MHGEFSSVLPLPSSQKPQDPPTDSMRTLFTNAKLTDEPQAATAQTYTVLVEDSRIASIAIQSDENGPGSVSVDRVIDLAGLYLGMRVPLSSSRSVICLTLWEVRALTSLHPHALRNRT